MTVAAVREANDLDEDDTIQPGQTLRIPRAASGSSTASSSGAARESGSRASSGSSASGTRDSGSRPASSASTGERRASTETARRSGGSEARPALSTVNRMPARREHTVGDGETLWGIARKYDSTVEDLRRANSLDDDDQIRPGQKLRIPD